MLINLRNALMAGKRLPYDAEVEYLQSSGTQWIDTGLLGRDGYDFEYSFRPMNPLPCGIGGGYEDNRNCYIGLVRNNGYLAYNYFTPNTIVEVQSLTLGTDYNVKAHLYSDEQYFDVNGVRGGIESRTGSFVSNSSLFVFAIRNGNQRFANANMRLYSLKIYLYGVLVRDYIPVRKGTVGYLYDRVSGKLFGNAGTGDFVLGPDVVPVEWLQSSGTQWIDTGVIPGLNFHIDVRGRKAGDYSANAAIFSNEGVNSYVDCYYNAGWGLRCYGNGMTRSIYDGWFDAKIDFDFTSSPTTTFHLNSEEATATTSKTEAQITGSTKSVRLFQGMYGKTNPVDIVFFNADKNGQPALRLRAVRVGTDATSWEGAMMDVLTRRVYRNAGTGAFTYGNDLRYPIPAE